MEPRAPNTPPPALRSTDPSSLRLLVAALVFVLGLFGGMATGAGLLLYVPPFGLLFEASVGWVIAFLMVSVALGGLPGVILFRRAWPRD